MCQASAKAYCKPAGGGAQVSRRGSRGGTAIRSQNATARGELLKVLAGLSGSSCDGGGARAARSGWGPQRRKGGSQVI